VGVKAEVKRIVDSGRQDIVLAIQKRLEGSGTIRHLIKDHVEVILSEEGELVSNGVGGCL
jgi:hypothetical protein